MSFYKKQMLKPSIELFESFPYNDDIEYLITDNLEYHSDIPYPNVEENKQVEELAQRELDMEYETIDFKQPGDLSHFSGVVEEVFIDFDSEVLENFENVFKDISDPDLSVQSLKNLSYDGIRYYCKTDTLVVPSVLLDYVNSNRVINKCKISVYNYKYCKQEIKDLIKCKTIEEPKLEFQFIPKEIKYAKIKEPVYTEDLENNVRALYMNLPREYYRKICLDNETLAYNINKECFIGHSNCNQTKLNHLCYDVAKNGFKKVIQLRLLEDGKLVPYFSNKRVLIAEYLDLPTIPVVIISNAFSYSPDRILYYDSGIVRDLANKYLAPHFIF